MASNHQHSGRFLLKRTLIACAFYPLLSVLGPQPSSAAEISLTKEHLEAVDRQRRIVINYDIGCTSPPFMCEGLEADELVKWKFSLIDQGYDMIDSVWWFFGDGEVIYPSEVLPRLKFRKFIEWTNQGVDLVRMYVEESRRRGLETFISCRLGVGTIAYGAAEHLSRDACHYEVVGQVEKDPAMQANPEWFFRLWEESQTADGYSYGLNFTQEGVRDLQLRVLRELATNYDMDGLELDFCRTLPALPLEQAWEKRNALTEFVRSVRMMTLQVEKKRGRPFLLAARVPGDVMGAKIDGVDLETWAEQGLVDIFVPGSRSFHYDLAGFRRIVEGTHIKIYPCHDTHHASDGYQYPRMKVVRGVAANWWYRGADGIQTFNYGNVTREASESFIKYGWSLWPWNDWEHQVYKEIGSPEVLRYKDKDFVVERRGGGVSRTDIWPSPDDWYTPKYGYANTNMFAPLPVTIESSGRVETIVPIVVADDVRGEKEWVSSLTLWVLLSSLEADSTLDEERLEKALVRKPKTKLGPSYNRPLRRGITNGLSVRSNGVVLPSPKIQAGWLVYPLKPSQLARGENIIGLRIQPRDGHTPDQLRIEKLEIRVRYSR